MDACNLDAGGVRKRAVTGAAFLVVGLGAAVWFIGHDRPLLFRIAAVLPCFLIASFSIFQARART